jgi:hypothetical protein
MLRHMIVCPVINPLNAKLNPICPLLALFGAHHILHVSGLRVKNKMNFQVFSDVMLCYWASGL